MKATEAPWNVLSCLSVVTEERMVFSQAKGRQFL
jgi:hypothetical protein